MGQSNRLLYKSAEEEPKLQPGDIALYEPGDDEWASGSYLQAVERVRHESGEPLIAPGVILNSVANAHADLNFGFAWNIEDESPTLRAHVAATLALFRLGRLGAARWTGDTSHCELPVFPARDRTGAGDLICVLDPEKSRVFPCPVTSAAREAYVRALLLLQGESIEGLPR